MRNSNRVAIACREGARYPARAPFHPSTPYPEYRFGSSAISSDENDTYDLIRESLKCLGADSERFGTADWNPLRNLVRPGDTVVLKPNWAVHEHRAGGDLACIVTHGAVIRAVADYVVTALKGRGRLLIADAPLPWADFGILAQRTGTTAVVRFLRESGAEAEVRDLRKILHLYTADDILGAKSRITLRGDPEGYATVDLGTDSEFSSLGDLSRLYGADYDRRETIRHHTGGRHEYLISRTILNADVVIGIPKLKVHRKVGATLNLKNLVGINGDKNYLPHFQIGAPSRGGDEFPDSIGAAAKTVHRLRRKLVDTFLTSGHSVLEKVYVMARDGYHAIKRPMGLAPEIVQAGDWYGNDTAWRMVLDLNKILHFADRQGRISDRLQRRFFSFVDGIVAGEGEGPLTPDPRACGVVIAGENPVAVDLAGLRLMGLDWTRLRLYRRATAPSRRRLIDFPPEQVQFASNQEGLAARMTSGSDRIFAFRPPKGWAGYCEIDPRLEERAG